MKYCIVFLFVIFCGCEKSQHTVHTFKQRTHELHHYYQSLQLNKKLDSIIVDVLRTHEIAKCQGEIFIDKIDDYRTIISIYIPREGSLFDDMIPLYFIDFGDCRFYVYNGIENQLYSDSGISKPLLKNQLKDKIYVQFIDSCGYYSTKTDRDPPFPLPIATGLPPPPPPPKMR